DVFSVAMHEIGHALGLGESGSAGSVMQGSYALKSGLSSDDITGIRSLYSNGNARSYDAYYGAATPNNSFANAANISSLISNLTAVVSGLDITTTSVNEYFTFTVPSGSQSSFTIKAQSAGFSLLAPALYV